MLLFLEPGFLKQALIRLPVILVALSFHEFAHAWMAHKCGDDTAKRMGRLTLNILLSFAQFEREVISERTRDKIAMARKRGKYTGGRPVLGYDIVPEGGKIIINETEAEQVRTIFDLYLKRGSMLPVVEKLDRLGWHTKTWVTRKGKVHQGRIYNKPSLHSLLTNPLYMGMVRYKGQNYDGEHDAIITTELFENTQRLLAENRRMPPPARIGKYGGLLKGILRCKVCNAGMSHYFSKKKEKRYRYYVCQNAISRGWKNCPHPSLPANEIELFVINEIRTIGLDKSMIDKIVSHSRESVKDETAAHKKRLKLLRTELDSYNSQLQPLLLLRRWLCGSRRSARVPTWCGSWRFSSACRAGRPGQARGAPAGSSRDHHYSAAASGRA